MRIEYTEVSYVTRDNIEISVHVQFYSRSGKIVSIIPFWMMTSANASNNAPSEFVHLREYFDAHYDEIEKAVVERIKQIIGETTVTEPWISVSARFPDKDDIDPYNHVIAWDAIHQQAICVFPEVLRTRKGLTHWKPTRLPNEKSPHEEDR